MGYQLQVLLSTYNGEQYIREQLDSILDQEYQDIKITIRDDGSTDSTVEILREYSERYSNISYYCGANIGSCYSFFDLMQHVSAEAEFVAFSDQDDVWLPKKLSIAVDRIRRESIERPVLYCSATQLVNENLQPIKQGITYKKIYPGFGNALVENMCTGCTAVINRPLYDILYGKIPKFTIMHDFWIYLTACCFGTVIYDTNSYILYRQHIGNVLGSPTSKLESYKRRIRNYKKNRGQLTHQVQQFKELYEVEGQNKLLMEELLETKVKILPRIRIIFSNRIYRQRRSDNIIFKILIGMGVV